MVVSLGFIVVGISGYYLKQKTDMQSNIGEKRKLVTSSLKDPSSSQFRNEIMKSGWLCGEVNSKNSYGAYTGFTRFVALDSRDAYLEHIGSVGTGESRFYFSSMSSYRTKQIEREIEMINYRKVNGTTPPFGSLTDEDRNRELFQEVWKSVCS